MTRRTSPTVVRSGVRRIVAAGALVLSVVACGGGPTVAAPADPDPRSAATTADADGYVGDRVGQFVTRCESSHRSIADPLVHPHGHAVAAESAAPPHSHEFFGNTGTDEHSTVESLAANVSTTCNLTDDRSAYWVPTLLRDNQPVAPTNVAAYYDTSQDVDATTVQPLPPGLSMIAGNDPRAPGRAGWTCGKSREVRPTAPTCPPMSALSMRVTFPDCWNGRDVASPDHRSHVAYRTSGACPPTHPVSIVRLVLDVRYPVHGDPAGLTLASGPMDTAHADVMNAWTERGMREQVELCIHRRVICGVA